MKLNVLRTYELTSKEGGEYNEKLEKMASKLGVKWCSIVEELSQDVDQATNEFDCHKAFSQMLFTKECQIKNKIVELANGDELDLYDFVDLMKQL